jgi:tellurite resistance-related uncharacterized protein
MNDAVPLESVRLPAGVELARTTPEFTAASVPAGLLSAHQVADGVWGRLRVLAGAVVYVVEVTGQRRTITAGGAQVIEPGLVHHVEPASDARFVVEFHR